MLDPLKDFFSAALSKLMDGARAVIAALLVRWATKVEMERDAYEKTSAVQKEQLDIAARPAAAPSSLRDRMRRDDL